MLLQVVVGADGICGVVMEHSQSEGITLLRFMEMFLEHLRRSVRDNIDWNSPCLPVERMMWKTPLSIREAIIRANEELQM